MIILEDLAWAWKGDNYGNPQQASLLGFWTCWPFGDADKSRYSMGMSSSAQRKTWNCVHLWKIKVSDYKVDCEPVMVKESFAIASSGQSSTSLNKSSANDCCPAKTKINTPPKPQPIDWFKPPGSSPMTCMIVQAFGLISPPHVYLQTELSVTIRR